MYKWRRKIFWNSDPLPLGKILLMTIVQRASTALTHENLKMHRAIVKSGVWYLPVSAQSRPLEGNRKIQATMRRCLVSFLSSYSKIGWILWAVEWFEDSKMRVPTAPPRNNSENPAPAIVRTDAYYHPSKFQLNRIRSVGCESWNVKVYGRTDTRVIL